MFKYLSLLTVFLATEAALLAAASPAPTRTPTPSSPPACVAPEFRQFDFWLGKWNVTDPQGKLAGTSEISRVSEGCALREQWISASGKSGTSINYFDPLDQQWHQDWVGGNGTILHLRGALKEGAMVLSGESRGTKGTIINRITWTPLPGEKVKQQWETSNNTGRSWTTIFVGIYERETEHTGE
ncbi:MAG: hypothetical protein ACREIF_11935 [Chthoniobacterales bacterium]